MIGFDTYVRIIDKKYYDDSEENLKRAMEDLLSLKIKFLVAMRGGQALEEESSLFESLSGFENTLSST